jgi:hypothetical protein
MGIDRPGGPYGEEMTAPPAWPEADETTLLNAADAFDADQKAVDDQLWVFQQARVRLFDDDAWSGQAANAAHAKHQQQISTLQAHVHASAVAAKLYRNAADVVVSTKNQIIENVENAQQLMNQVANDPQATAEQKDYFIKALVKATHAENVERVQAGATRLGKPPASPVTVRPADFTGRGVPQAPPKDAGPQIPGAGTDPKEVNRWWDSLSQEQKDRLIAQHPRDLGNLYGVPSDVRDNVNQAVMNDDLNRVEAVAHSRGVSAADVAKDPGKYGLSATDITRYQNGVKTRDGLNYDRGSDPKNPKPVMLLAYDPEAFNGQGKAAIAIGNPDYARNTAVIVPGTGSSVAQGWMAGHDDAINLYDQSLKADPQHHYTSVIAWMGYDAPDGFSDQRVMTPGLAREGGALLAQDVNGLWATHDGSTPQHITVIGHSYGSTTVADAFANSGMHANDAVLIGCPGTDLAHSAADFHLDGGHVYVGSGSTDPVSWIGESQGVPRELVRQYLSDHWGVPIPPDAGLGRDPAGDGFGSIRFHAEVPGSEGLSRSDHSHYYVMGSEALRSMTDIASGHPERLDSDGLIADGRRQPHIGPLRVPGLPAYIDPEAARPPDTIHDDHAY